VKDTVECDPVAMMMTTRAKPRGPFYACKHRGKHARTHHTHVFLLTFRPEFWPIWWLLSVFRFSDISSQLSGQVASKNIIAKACSHQMRFVDVCIFHRHLFHRTVHDVESRTAAVACEKRTGKRKPHLNTRRHCLVKHIVIQLIVLPEE
jgi:hypothetical protein